jgi:hypothetical protein
VKRNRFLARTAVCGLIGPGLAAGVAQAQPKAAKSSNSVAAKARVAELVRNAFGAIWIDSDLELFDIEADVRAALDAGISPNVRNEFGETLLLQAVENLRLSTIQILLRRGANPNLAILKDDFVPPASQTPIPQAILNAVSRVGETPLTRIVAMDESFFENKTDRLQIVRWLLGRGANSNARNKATNSALILAALHGESSSVPLLLRYGADFRLRDAQRQTALQIASVPAPRGSISLMSGSFPDFRNAKTEQQKQLAWNKHEKELEKRARQMEDRISTGRAVIVKLLKAAGATQ